jgi:hypothetical protein
MYYRTRNQLYQKISYLNAEDCSNAFKITVGFGIFFVILSSIKCVILLY